MRIPKYALLVVPLAVLFVLPAFSAISAQQQKVIALDLTEGRPKDPGHETAWIPAIEGNLTQAGYRVIEITDGITPEKLQGVDALVVPKLYNAQSVYSNAEIRAIADWFKEGDKFLWIGADSDWVEDYLKDTGCGFKTVNPNKILEAVGSHLRLDPCSIEDPETNAGAPYRVVSNHTNKQPWASEITQGVTQVLFHGPTHVIGYKDGQYVPLDQVLGDNLMWLFETTPGKGVVVDHDDDPTSYVYQEGDNITAYLAAAEKVDVGGGKISKVIVTGESLIGDRCVFNWEYHGVRLDGPKFVMNAFAWGLKPESAPGPGMDVIIGGIVVIVIIVAVLYFALAKK